jgi:hypothetical protein
VTRSTTHPNFKATLVAIGLLAAGLCAPVAQAATHHAHAGSQHSRAVPGVPRDSHGKIKRDLKARADFKHEHPCPSTGKKSGRCPGYTIDHVVPLKRGGADSPANMQWQTNEAARAKDKIE